MAQRREGFFFEKEKERRFGRATVWPSSDKQCFACSTSGAKALLLRKTPKQWHACVFLNKKSFTALPFRAGGVVVRVTQGGATRQGPLRSALGCLVVGLAGRKNGIRSLFHDCDQPPSALGNRASHLVDHRIQILFPDNWRAAHAVLTNVCCDLSLPRNFPA